MKKTKKTLSRKESSKKSFRPLATVSESNNHNSYMTSSNILSTQRNNNTLLTQPSLKSRVMVNGINIPHISLDPESTMRGGGDISSRRGGADENMHRPRSEKKYE